MVVYENAQLAQKREISASRVSGNGELLAWFAVSDLTYSCLYPAAAYDTANDQYLVVWMYDVNDDGSQFQIWGRIIEGDSAGTAAPS